MRVLLIFLISVSCYAQHTPNPFRYTSNSSGGVTLPIYLEAECATVGSNWNTTADATGTSPHDLASGPSNEYVDRLDGNSTATPSSPAAADIVVFTFDVDTAGEYTIKIRASSVNDAGNNSAWCQVNSGTWFQYGIVSNTDRYRWQSDADFQPTVTLAAGTNTITFHNREDGFRLDKLVIGDGVGTDMPADLSEDFESDGINCP